MKSLDRLIFLLVFAIVFTMCHEAKDKVLSDDGTIKSVGSLSVNKYMILLDSGDTLIPTYFPDYFIPAEGTKVKVYYSYLNTLSQEGPKICKILKIKIAFPQQIIIHDQKYNPELRSDPLSLLSSSIESNCLILKLQYRGGCCEHDITLHKLWAPNEPSTLFPLKLQLSHNPNGDICKSLVTKIYYVDLTPIQIEGKHEVHFLIAYYDSNVNYKTKEMTYAY
ncbi:MAG: hypothetical protein Q8862_04725 [Bacteroidota bacterium]|nr:hypothetical protein [Bacteroidota bacterium]MDP4204559.1 hypothetical protein [Bacteroidota bacterium]